MSEHKALTGVEIKDADQGLVSAVFATLNVVDSDGDVTVPGAFEDGAEVRISSFGHTSWGGALPAGKGKIRVEGDEAILDGQLFLNTTHGRDHFETLKEMGPLMEWSYGFDILESGDGEHDDSKVRFLRKLKVHEVSPVLLGAGVDTRTLSVKEHLTFTDEAMALHASAESLVKRVTSLAEVERGHLTVTKRESLTACTGALREFVEALEKVLADTDPEAVRKELMREAARFEFLRASL